MMLGWQQNKSWILKEKLHSYTTYKNFSVGIGSQHKYPILYAFLEIRSSRRQGFIYFFFHNYGTAKMAIQNITRKQNIFTFIYIMDVKFKKSYFNSPFIKYSFFIQIVNLWLIVGLFIQKVS